MGWWNVTRWLFFFCQIIDIGLGCGAQANDHEDLVVLGNKRPKWSENMGAYCLNFSGRVTVPSVKNFQLVTEEDGKALRSQPSSK